MENISTVKVTMSRNISQMLENSVKIDQIDDRAKDLTEQSMVFKKKSTSLKKHMRCKNRKMNLIIAAVAILILGIVALVIVLNTTGNGGGGGAPPGLARPPKMMKFAILVR